jgi:hypothetical protein
MQRRQFMSLGGALVLAAVLSGCGDDRFPDYHYKMTIYVATPEGEKAFSSVRAVKQEQESSIQSSSGYKVKTTIEGQAVILDLPGDKTVYALISEGAQTVYPAFSPYVPVPGKDPRFDTGASNPTGYLDDLAAQSQAMVKLKGPRELPRTAPLTPSGPQDAKPTVLWPTFVSFDDPADPKTVRAMTPEEVGVKRITMEISQEPVTKGIQTRLVWLDRYRTQSRSLSGDSSNVVSTNELRDNIGAGAFIEGTIK